MKPRLLCRMGFHKFTEMEVHFKGEPVKGGPASIIERCECGESRLLRYERPTSFHIWQASKGHNHD